MDTLNYYEKIVEATDFIQSKIDINPEVGVVLGTGLGNFTTHLSDVVKLNYSDIPHFPEATVKGHDGSLLTGLIGQVPVIAQNGRYHYYEGYDMKQVTMPIRVFGMLGVKILIIASAVGGIHEDYEAGDISVVNDHINLHHANPLTGHNDERLGPRFPDMSDAYDPELIKYCHAIAKRRGIKIHDSVYAGLPGPNLETKAEYQYLHTIGGTVVGMSTVPEVIVARHMSIRTCVLTAITNKCFPISAITKTTHDEVISVAQKAEYSITRIVLDLINSWALGNQ